MKTFNLQKNIGWDTTIKDLQKFLVDANGEDIFISIDSGGGDCLEGFGMFHMLQNYKGRINIVMGALTASIASYISALPNSKVFVYNSSIYMQHNPWNLAIGDYLELRQAADISEGFANIIASAYSAKCGSPKKKILEDMKNQTWLFGQEIIDAGYADELIKEDQKIEGLDLNDVKEKNNDWSIWNKSEAKQQALVRLQETKNKLKEVNEDSFSKIAAIIKEQNIQANLNIEKNNKGVNMDLKTFLKENPTAQAEYNTLLDSVKAETVKQSRQEDRARIIQILDLSDFNISDNIKDSIKNGTEPGSYAIEKLQSQKEEAKKEIEDQLKLRNQKPNQDLGKIKTDVTLGDPNQKPKSKIDASIESALDADINNEKKRRK